MQGYRLVGVRQTSGACSVPRTDRRDLRGRALRSFRGDMGTPSEPCGVANAGKNYGYRIRYIQLARAICQRATVLTARGALPL